MWAELTCSMILVEDLNFCLSYLNDVYTGLSRSWYLLYCSTKIKFKINFFWCVYQYQTTLELDVNSLRDRTTNFGCNGFFSKYAGKTIIANGGPFYFTAGLKSTVTGEYPIDFLIRPYINVFLFHGFWYDSNIAFDGNYGVTENYDENRYNIAPKMVAKANRKDGFTIFSLEYKSGRSGIISDAFNVGTRGFGFVGYLSKDIDLNRPTMLFWTFYRTRRMMWRVQLGIHQATCPIHHRAVFVSACRKCWREPRDLQQ